MNFMRAVGFLMLGAVQWFLPHLAPAWCVANGVEGSSVRGLWLDLMGMVQIGIALGYFLRRTGSALARAMRYDPPLLAARAQISARKIQPAIGWTQRAIAGRRHTWADAPVPMALESALLEPRRAV